ncbi:MAG: hypothetical protein JSV68_20765, partial [Anaerolineaceae bacterium]
MNSKLLLLLLTLSTLMALAACNTASGIEPTADQSVYNPEQSVVGALTDYLEGQGAQVKQMDLLVKAIADDYAWVEVVSNDPTEPDGFNAFMKRENGVWKTVVYDSGIEKERLEKLGIPKSVWPEDWLSQAAQPEIPAQPTSTPSASICPTATIEAQTQSLIDEVRGFCLLYPASHTVEQLDSGNTEIVFGSVMNHIDPRASIVVEDLAGRKLEQVVEEFLADYQGFDIKRTQLTVGGETAIQLDHIPGQDFYRKVMVARDGSLYQMSFSPYDPGLVDTFAQADQIYRIVIDSFRFVSPNRKPATGFTSESVPPICPDLPRPAMVFRADDGEDYILRHVPSGTECTMQFDPPPSRTLYLSADGIYFSA